jgi:hypothetical protein
MYPQVNIGLVFSKTLLNSKNSAQMPEYLLAFKEKTGYRSFQQPLFNLGQYRY